MSETARNLVRRGLISEKAFNAMAAKTKPQASKMAAFSGKSKDEGDNKRKSIPGTNTKGIDTNQSKGSPVAGAPSARGGLKDGASPKAAQINQGKSTPAPGGRMSTSGKKTVGVRHAPAPTGGQYGGGGRNTQ